MISLVVPTYKEAENIGPLLSEIRKVLDGAGIGDYEIWVMDDDSKDGTEEFVRGLSDPKVRIVNRKGRPRGLSAAVIDGFLVAKGDIVGVMDADLSHPPALLPKLIAAIEGGANIAVGSRYVAGGGIKDWPFKRVLTSRVACVIGGFLTPVKDCTSGYFLVRKSVIEGVELSPIGFKIGLEVFVKARHEGNTKEVPFVFTDRRAGSSKLSSNVIFAFLKQWGALSKLRSKSEKHECCSR